MQRRTLVFFVFIFWSASWASSANAVLVSTSVGDYEVVSQVDIDLALAELQPWWGDRSLAAEFASLVQDALGASVNPVVFPDLGPAFLYSQQEAVHWEAPLNQLSAVMGPFLEISPIVYAVVAPTSVANPATIALFLIGIFGLIGVRQHKNLAYAFCANTAIRAVGAREYFLVK